MKRILDGVMNYNPAVTIQNYRYSALHEYHDSVSNKLRTLHVHMHVYMYNVCIVHVYTSNLRSMYVQATYNA